MSQPLGTCVIVLDASKEKVLLGRRKNSYMSGYLGLPGGRIEVGEEAQQAAKREVKEETSLEITELTYASTIKDFQETYDFIHLVYVADQFEGDPTVCEPEKCESWDWYPLAELPKDILKGHHLALQSYIQQIQFIDSYKTT